MLQIVLQFNKFLIFQFFHFHKSKKYLHVKICMQKY